MKKKFLKPKIIMTNISRVIMSFLFVNMGYLFQNSVQGVQGAKMPEPSCYLVGSPIEPKVNLEKVFIIAIPIVLVIALVLFIIVKKKKSKKNKEKGKMTNQGEKDV